MAHYDFLELRQKALEKRFSHINPKQREAVFQVNGPLLILAGAGSGKTTVVINRIAFMVRFGDAYHSAYIPAGVTEEQCQALQNYIDGKTDLSDEELSEIFSVYPVRPWNILAITFTNKAAKELRERLDRMLGAEEAEEVMASTFHSCCVRILRRDIDKLDAAYTRSFAIYDTSDAERVIKDAMGELKVDDKMFKPKAVLGEISRAKDELLSPEEYLEKAGSDFRKQQIGKIYAAYAARMKKANALDFDDLIVQTVRLFQQRPEVLEYYQNRWRYVMIDEYQDTNHAQYMLASLLAGRYQNLCVVGDDDQSIYKFRGATIENILSFEDQFKNTTVIRLEQNYRSTQTILDAANEVIRHNTARKGKNLWTENGPGDKIVLEKVQNAYEEAQFIADTIEKNVASGMRYGDHAVLYRMNAQSSVIEQHFIKAGIPYRLFGGTKFFDRKEVKDLIAYLSIIVNPSDTVRLARIINEPKRSIGDATVSTVMEIAAQAGIPAFEVLRHADQYGALARKAGPLSAFAYMIDSFRDDALNLPLEELLDRIMEKSGYLVMLKNQGDEGLNRLENIGELKSTMAKYQQENPEGDLDGFLEEIALYTDLDDMNEQEDSVMMMTMHSSKGLEFPVVFLPGMEDGVFPSVRSIYEPEELEEERRLCYVAITRARKKLYISHAYERMVFGTTNRNRLSRFAAEIPEDKLEMVDTTAARREAYQARLQAKREGGLTTPVPKETALAGMGPKPDAVSIDYAVGSRVRHKTFGEGLVLSIRPMGKDSLVEVAFDKVGTKKIMANFARLEKLS